VPILVLIAQVQSFFSLSWTHTHSHRFNASVTASFCNYRILLCYKTSQNASIVTGSSWSSSPSHQYIPSAVIAVLVKIEFLSKVAIALGLVFQLVPGQTPKNPHSGLMPRSSPWSLNLIHAMSSPKQLKYIGIILSIYSQWASGTSTNPEVHNILQCY